jgi:SSS family solute:Na+ symporter
MFLLGILWKRTTHAGALTAGLLTVPLSFAIEYFFPHMPFYHRTRIVFWTCMIACVLVSLYTPGKTEEELKGLIWKKDSLSLPAAEKYQQRGLRNPFIWWALVTSVILFFYIKFG